MSYQDNGISTSTPDGWVQSDMYADGMEAAMDIDDSTLSYGCMQFDLCYLTGIFYDDTSGLNEADIALLNDFLASLPDGDGRDGGRRAPAVGDVGPVLLLLSIFGTTMTGFALVGSTGKAYELGLDDLLTKVDDEFLAAAFDFVDRHQSMDTFPAATA